MLVDDPSLRAYPAQVLAAAYDTARLQAAKETGLDFTLFPAASPFTDGQVLDPDFLPP